MVKRSAAFLFPLFVLLVLLGTTPSPALAQSSSSNVEVNAAVDREDPTATITAPPDGSTVSDNVTIQVEANDDGGITKVEFYVDGFLKLTDTSSSYEFIWDTLNETNGNHTITVIAYDIVGKTATDSVTYTVNNVPPTPTAPEQPSQQPEEKAEPLRRFFLIDIPSLTLLAPEGVAANDFLFGVLISIEIFLIIFLLLWIKRTKPKKQLRNGPGSN